MHLLSLALQTTCSIISIHLYIWVGRGTMRVRTQCNDARATGVYCINHWARLCLVFHSDGWNGVYPNMTGIGLKTFYRGSLSVLKPFYHNTRWMLRLKYSSLVRLSQSIANHHQMDDLYYFGSYKTKSYRG